MSESVLIVGCGVFGLSTALQLAREGYKVTAIDKYPIPSPQSAANDLNKIIRCEYSDLFYAKLSIEALESWKNDPLYKDLYVECGRVMLSPLDSVNIHRSIFEDQGFKNLRNLGFDLSNLKTIKNGNELSEFIPHFQNNKFGKMNAKFNPNSGYGKSKDSLIKIYKECVKLNVKFIFGDKGNAIKHTKNSIIASSGDIYTADKILVSLGSSTGFLINLENQIRSLGLFVTHLHLNEEEYLKYKDIPVFFSSDLGYFFPPDEINHDLKFALTFGDVFNKIKNGENELYLPNFNSELTFPKQGESQIRNLLSLVLPDLKNHKLYKSKVCWISDTTTSDFLIDKVPNTDNIFVATGDSGHGYKFLPNIGKYISLKLQNKLNQEVSNRWKWKSNPIFPTQFVNRSKRQHLEIKDIKNWRVDDIIKSRL